MTDPRLAGTLRSGAVPRPDDGAAAASPEDAYRIGQAIADEGLTPMASVPRAPWIERSEPSPGFGPRPERHLVSGAVPQPDPWDQVADYERIADAIERDEPRIDGRTDAWRR